MANGLPPPIPGVKPVRQEPTQKRKAGGNMLDDEFFSMLEPIVRNDPMAQLGVTNRVTQSGENTNVAGSFVPRGEVGGEFFQEHIYPDPPARRP